MIEEEVLKEAIQEITAETIVEAKEEMNVEIMLEINVQRHIQTMTGIVQNAIILTLPEELNAIDVVNLRGTQETEMTAGREVRGLDHEGISIGITVENQGEMTEAIGKHSLIMIGPVKNVITRTSLFVKNAIGVENPKLLEDVMKEAVIGIMTIKVILNAIQNLENLGEHVVKDQVTLTIEVLDL